MIGLNFVSRGSLVAISARNVVTFPSFPFFSRAYLLRSEKLNDNFYTGWMHEIADNYFKLFNFLIKIDLTRRRRKKLFLFYRFSILYYSLIIPRET